MITLKHKYYNEYDRETYYEYDIWKKELYKNKQVEKLIVKAFANYYKVSNDIAQEIIENFDLWEDEGLLEELLENYMEELDEIFWNEDYWNEDNRYKKDGAC